MCLVANKYARRDKRATVQAVLCVTFRKPLYKRGVEARVGIEPAYTELQSAA